MMRLRGKRRRAAWLVGLVLLAGGAWWLSRTLGGPAEGSWVEARVDDLVLDVEIRGSLRAVDTSLVGPPSLREFWDFKIAMMAPEGEEVAEGDPVLAFDVSDLRASLQRQIAESEEARKQIEKTQKSLEVSRRQDELRLAEAEARLRKAQLKLARPEDLVSSKDLEIARLDLELAELEVAHLRQRLAAAARSAEAQLAALRNQQQRADRRKAEIESAIEQMVRPAPRAGTVIYVRDWQDRKKNVGDAVWVAERVIELPDLTHMEADGRVDEADAGRIVEGQPVYLRLDAHQDVEFSGKVASIWKTVQRESWRSPLKIVRLEIELDETDTRRMRPGMRFRGRVETERVSDVLLLPAEAVFHRPAGPVVYRRGALGINSVPVELGRRNADYVEVVAGLAAGDVVSLEDLGATPPRDA